MGEEQNERSVAYDVTRSYLPFATVISLIGFVVWSTHVVTTAKVKVDVQMEKTSSVVAELAEATKELADLLVVRSRERWTRTEMQEWCIAQKEKYVELACPNFFTPRRIEDVEMPNGVSSPINRLKQIQEKAKVLDKVGTDDVE
jgi:hypothetical protein